MDLSQWQDTSRGERQSIVVVNLCIGYVGLFLPILVYYYVTLLVTDGWYTPLKSILAVPIAVGMLHLALTWIGALQTAHTNHKTAAISAAKRAKAEAEAKRRAEEEKKKRAEKAAAEAKRQKELAAAEAKRREERAAANRKRQQQFARHEQQFYGELAEKYDLPRVAAIANGYTTYPDRSQWAAEAENKNEYYIYGICEDWKNWWRDTQSQTCVENSKRIQHIESQLTESGLVPVSSYRRAKSAADAPCLTQFVCDGKICEEPLAMMYGGCVAFGSSTPEKLVGGFVTERKKELEDLAYCRLSYFYDDYKIMHAGLVGEQAVRDVLDMHKGAFYTLYGLRIPLPGTEGKRAAVETDVLILAPYGIFAIEIKNYAAAG